MTERTYIPAEDRYESMIYRRCGRSGLMLPAVSLGLWQNFGDAGPSTPSAASCGARSTSASRISTWPTTTVPRTASAESNFGRILRTDFRAHRDELVISTKAGWDMWPGPYGDLGSRKYLLASLDQSLRRIGVDYVDIFYHHRFDPNTPLEESLGALHTAVQQGRHSMSASPHIPTAVRPRPSPSCVRSGLRCSFTSPPYSMLNRWIEQGLLDVLGAEGVGCIAFSPLAQGMLTSRYLHGIPEGLAR